LDDETEHKETLPHRIQKLIDELPIERELVRQRIHEKQNKQKVRHDRQVNSNVVFAIGDKVLLYRAEKDKQWSGKLDEKWKGPYYIHLVLPNGSYKLRTLTGLVLKTPFNGKLLKLYYDRND